jgi:hypothetical protein
MPNWCNNNLTLQHEDPAMIKRAYDALERGEFLNEFIPVPESLKIVSGRVGDGEEQRKLEEDTARNLEVHGYGNWYDYCVGEWGTKWDVGEQGASDIHPDGKILHTYFDSAWAPPIAAYEKLEQLGFTVGAMYYESGMCYAGRWEDGNDDYYDLGGMNSEQVASDLPSELDEAFSISETIAEYEAEQEEEELTEWIKDGVEERKKIGLVTE